MAQNMQNMSAEGLANIAKEAAASGQDPQEAVADFVQQTLEAAQAVEPTISSNLGNLQLKSTKGKKTKRFKNKVAGNVNIQALVESQVQERLWT